MIYLDYNATTPMGAGVVEAMLPYLRGGFGNPSSIHGEGRRARAAIDEAREVVAEALGVRAHEVIFTGGGTESCNLGVLGLARAHVCRGRHVITSAVEHHAVLHAVEQLAHHEGFEVTVLPVNGAGEVDPESLRGAIRADTTVVSVMHANNETGVIQPVAELAAICRERGVHFHTDAVQTVGKLDVNFHALGVSALSLAAHKFYGPKGVGALVLGAGIALTRSSHGGSQENTRRPGTENTAGIVGLAEAIRTYAMRGMADQERQRGLRDLLWAGILRVYPGARRNGDPERSLGNTLNVSFPGCDGEALLMGLDLEGVAVSSGSACMVGSMQPSHVLLAMGVEATSAAAAVRFSLGTDTTESDIRETIRAVAAVTARHQPQLAA